MKVDNQEKYTKNENLNIYRAEITLGIDQIQSYFLTNNDLFLKKQENCVTI